MKKTILIIYLIFCIIALTANILENISAKYSNISSFEADISQTNFFSQIDYTLESQGKIFIFHNSFVIEYLSPIYQFIKIENEIVTMYSQQENTAIVTSNASAFNNITSLFTEILTNKFVAGEVKNGLHEYTVLENFDSISNMKIFINENTNLLEKISYSDTEDNIVTINISNQVFNEALSKSIESFVIPENATIIYD